MYLTADIGGTNSRFALFEKNKDEYTFLHSLWCATQDVVNFGDLLLNLKNLNTDYDLERISACVFAVAGRVENANTAKLSHADWVIDIKQLQSAISFFPNSVIVNDFSAQAAACCTSLSQKFIPLFHANNFSKTLAFPLAICGAGTGFGAAALFGSQEKPLLMPSEFGHTFFPFLSNNKEEQEFAQYLFDKTHVEYPMVDSVVSGSGLCHLHTFLTNEVKQAHEIEVSSPAFTRFSRYYARVLRDFCITALPKTLVLTGGIAAKHEHIFNAVFWKEFTASPHHSEHLKQMSLYLNKEENAALYGATYFFDKNM